MDTITRQILHASLIEGIGPAAIQLIFAAHPQVNFYELGVSDCMRYGLSEQKAQLLVRGLADQKLLETELALIGRYNIEIISLIDPCYPPLLKEIYLPPAILYYQGNRSALLQQSLAIVGSRKADNYGKRVIDMLLPPLVEGGLAIISGGAFGIDTFAHAKTLEVKGTTVVVLGSGLLQPYPAANKKLFEKVVESGGAVISSFPLQTTPAPGNFPARNRIIAGLGKGCLVVQADIKSGARITASYALEQGREVFAVPGPIDSPLSAGCHALISQGATLVTSVADIFMQINPDWVFPNASERVSLQKDVVEKPTGSSIQDQLLYVCKVPQSFDGLLEHTSLGMDTLQNLLFTLQLEGKIEQNFAGLWVGLE